VSAVQIEHRNAEGVLLRYRIGERHAFHDDRRPQPSDRLQMALLRAERKLRVLEIIAEHLELSDVGADRVAYALRSIQALFTLARAELGLCVEGRPA
jgi:hypothetical protein